MSSEKKELTNEIILTLKNLSTYKYSPEKKKIIYLISQSDLKENKNNKELYVMNSDGSETKLISTPGESIAEPAFILKGEKIVYILNGELYFMNLDGTNKKKILCDKKEINSNVEGFLFSENLDKLILVKLVKLENLQVKMGNDVYKDCDKATNCYIADDLCYTHWNAIQNQIQRPFIYNVKYDQEKDDIIIDEKSEINMLEKYTFECPSAPFGGMEEITMNSKGDKVYFMLRRFTGREYVVSTNIDIFEYTFGKDEFLNICKGAYENKDNLKVNIYDGVDFSLSFKGQQDTIQKNVEKLYGDKTFYKKNEKGKFDFNLGYNTEPKLSPDNKMICWLSMERDGYESDITRLCVFNFETKEKFYLTEGFDTSISGYCWGLDNKTIYFTAVWDAVFQIYKTDIINKKVEKITNEICNFRNISILDENHLLAMSCSMLKPLDLYIIDLTNNTVKQITFLNKETYENIQMPKVEKRMVETFDKKSMLCWVIYPPNFDPNNKYPALLYCQGGPQSSVSQFFSTRWNFSLMASHGYVVIAPNRRGLPGFGREWLEEISGDYYNCCMKDYLSAIDDLAKENYINKDKLGAVGASFGGYSVYWLAGNHEKRFKAFVSHAGMFNIESFYYETEEMWFANWDNEGAPWMNKEGKFKNFLHSPHLYVDKWDTPILCIHGEKDYRILHSQ
jgi:dipeptidyl aminopeptidase/acylaminoacyl peptidase